MHFSVLLSLGILALIAIQVHAEPDPSPNQKHRNPHRRKKSDIFFDFTAKRVRIGDKSPRAIPIQTLLPFPMQSLVIKQGRGNGTINYLLNPSLILRLESIKVLIKKIAAKSESPVTQKLPTRHKWSGANTEVTRKQSSNIPRNKRNAYYLPGSESVMNGHGFRGYEDN